MLFKKKVKEPTVVDKEIARLYDKLSTIEPDTKEYTEVLTHIGTLTEYRNVDRPEKLKKDTMVSAAAQILGVGIIVGGESIGSRLLSKNAFGFLPKSRI